MSEYRGTCFCGAIEVTVTGDPVAMGYCHCNSCREWSAAPVNAFALWKPSEVAVTKGEGALASFKKTERSDRRFCRTCGGHVMAVHPAPVDLVELFPAILPELTYAPKFHLGYSEKVLSIRDGLPKYKDLPAEMGGSGETLPE